MRVALSLVTLDPRIAGGSDTYVRGLTTALAHVGRHEYAVLVSRLAPDAGGGLPTTVAAGFPSTDGTAGRVRSLLGVAARPGRLRALLDAADVVHYPVTVPLPSTNRPTVVTLHDLQHRELPEFIAGSRRAFRRLAYDATAKRADQVIVVSEWVRGRAIELLGLDPARVHAIPLGVNAGLFRPDPTVVRERFLLYPARRWPHKNHARLLEGFARLRRDDPELRLVLTGGGHEGASPADGVVVRGHVAADELVSLYRRAAAVVFPSLYEGFGLPVVEAMACGCPVAASRAGALQEVCGDAARLFEPRDVDELVRATREVLDDATAWSARSLARATAFTWEATARAHDVVYARLGAGALGSAAG